MRLIFVLGGVISGLGKGVTSGSIGATLKEMGYNNITIKKLDPYLNIDPGTMNPVEHGEVYVTDDGGETDLDLGYYERFAGIKVGKNNSVSAGKLMYSLLNAERRGEFLGKTVQIIPHFTNRIKQFILQNDGKYDFVICEIGGSVGDYEASPFLESVRQLRKDLGKKSVMICLVSYIVYYQASKELKTKPTQSAIRQLMQCGIQPDVLFSRTEYDLDDKIRDKLELYTNVDKDNIIQAKNVPNIYEIPLEYMKEGLVKTITSHFNIKIKHKPTFKKWFDLRKKIRNLKYEVSIGMVGKYIELEDSYCSVIESLNHAGWDYNTKVNIVWINVRKEKDMYNKLDKVDGVLVPGGFGSVGVEEIMSAIKYCRENKIPLFGICFGLQLSVIEFCRNVLGIKNATSKEFGKKGDTFVVDLMTEWKTTKGILEKRTDEGDLGGTLRLGSYKTILTPGTLAYKLYGNEVIYERHRHRYEVNIKYREQLEKHGLIFSGMSPDNKLPELIEINKYIDKNGVEHTHPFFIGIQGHPEFNSDPFKPGPLFKGLVKASLCKYKSITDVAECGDYMW